jgi:hypothetical protein
MPDYQILGSLAIGAIGAGLAYVYRSKLLAAPVYEITDDLRAELLSVCSVEMISVIPPITNTELPLLFVPTSRTSIRHFDRNPNHYLLCPNTAELLGNRSPALKTDVVIKRAYAFCADRSIQLLGDQQFDVNGTKVTGDTIQIDTQSQITVDDLFRMQVRTNAYFSSGNQPITEVKAVVVVVETVPVS